MLDEVPCPGYRRMSYGHRGAQAGMTSVTNRVPSCSDARLHARGSLGRPASLPLHLPLTICLDLSSPKSWRPTLFCVGADFEIIGASHVITWWSFRLQPDFKKKTKNLNKTEESYSLLFSELLLCASLCTRFLSA